MKTFKIFGYLGIYLILSLPLELATAQSKLPNKQSAAIWANINKVKIDGKADEWNDRYQAYNKATDLFYTLANNENFLYLIIHVEDPGVIETLTHFGFTFSVQPQEEKDNGKDFTTIQFPLSETKQLGLVLNKPGVEQDTSASNAKMIMNSNNNILQTRHKVIVVNTINEADTISVYNELGFKIVETFDSKRYYTLEMAIPAKYLKFSKKGTSILSYHLLINGYQDSKLANYTLSVPPGGFTPQQQQAINELDGRINKRWSRTDFRGEYVLATK